MWSETRSVRCLGTSPWRTSLSATRRSAVRTQLNSVELLPHPALPCDMSWSCDGVNTWPRGLCTGEHRHPLHEERGECFLVLGHAVETVWRCGDARYALPHCNAFPWQDSSLSWTVLDCLPQHTQGEACFDGNVFRCHPTKLCLPCHSGMKTPSQHISSWERVPVTCHQKIYTSLAGGATLPCHPWACLFITKGMSAWQLSRDCHGDQEAWGSLWWWCHRKWQVTSRNDPAREQ